MQNAEMQNAECENPDKPDTMKKRKKAENSQEWKIENTILHSCILPSAFHKLEVIMAEELELNSTQVEHEYGGSEIQVLEGLEAVRKRPGMYIGSTSESGLHHLVYEIVDNSIDEALAGYCTDITVTINPGNTITVTDNGRGIPVDIQPQTGRPALEVVFTVLHAGGKFGGGGYKVSGGLHGVGASVVNALSEWLEVQVHKNGEIYEMKFSRGKITQEMKVVGKTDHTGTTVTFKPDPEMFDTLEYSYDTLHTRMREEAFLNAGLRIQTVDLRPGQEQEDDMCYEGGIREFVTFINRNTNHPVGIIRTIHNLHPHTIWRNRIISEQPTVRIWLLTIVCKSIFTANGTIGSGTLIFLANCTFRTNRIFGTSIRTIFAQSI